MGAFGYPISIFVFEYYNPVTVRLGALATIVSSLVYPDSALVVDIHIGWIKKEWRLCPQFNFKPLC